MAGITHKWNGTVLTITSDSGTSSADLKGAKGDDGARGAQGSVCDVAVMANYVAANAAPKGLISNKYSVYSNTEIDNAIKDAWNNMADSSTALITISALQSGLNLSGGNWHITLYQTTYAYGSLMAIKYNGYGVDIMYRNLFNGVWGDWEWENPPLIAGTAYRTTERYNGAAVYQKLVYIANLPNNSSKTIDGVIESGITRLVDLQYTINTSWTKRSNDSRVDMMLGTENPYAWLTITTTADLSTYSGYVLIKWTRD